jgi:hypothetical protein
MSHSDEPHDSYAVLPGGECYLGDQFARFVEKCWERIRTHNETYRDAWREKDNLAELQDEMADAFNYGFFDWLKADEQRRRKTDKPEAGAVPGA